MKQMHIFSHCQQVATPSERFPTTNVVVDVGRAQAGASRTSSGEVRAWTTIRGLDDEGWGTC